MISEADKKKYKKFDEILKVINKNFITLKDNDREKYTCILQNVMREMKKRMQDASPLFEACVADIKLAGSSYDGVKVGKPDEFDMNIVISLPVNYNDIEVVNAPGKPGYVTLNFEKAFERLEKHTEWSTKYKYIEKFYNRKTGQLCQKKFHSWMESVVTLAVNKMDEGIFGNYIFRWDECCQILYTSKSGPAITLHLTCNGKPINVDLVPVFLFNSNRVWKWPDDPVRPMPNNCKKKEWSAVPKPDKPNSSASFNPFWRLSFAEQEREIIHNQGTMKNTIRQLKKMRDNYPELRWLPSYFIKTEFLWVNDEPNSDQIWKMPMGAVFMHMLKKLHESMVQRDLRFYWAEDCNMLDSRGSGNVATAATKLKKIIEDLDKNVDSNPHVIARHLLTDDEYQEYIDISTPTEEEPEPILPDYEPERAILPQTETSCSWFSYLAAATAAVVVTGALYDWLAEEERQQENTRTNRAPVLNAQHVYNEF